MAAELVETDRLRARRVAAIQPEWAESLAGDLVKRSYGEPVVGRAGRPRRGRGDGHAVRPAHRRTTVADRSRPGRPAAGTRDVHPARTRRRRLGGRATSSWPRTLASSSESACSRRAFDGPTCSTTKRSFEFYDERVAAPTSPPRRALRSMVEATPSRPTRTCSTSTGRSLTNRSRHPTGRLSRPVARRRRELPDHVPLRARAAPLDGATINVPVTRARPRSTTRASTGSCRGTGTNSSACSCDRCRRNGGAS